MAAEPGSESTAPGRRLQRELRTVRAMLGIHCRDRHGTRSTLCPDCGELWTYARDRIDGCRFGEDKPTCANCPVHCFKPAMRERIREVMRYTGPRMLWRHPILALFHVVDGRRKPPRFPGTEERRP